MLFWGYCSTRPHNFIHILPADYLNCNWFFCKSSICSWPYSSRTQIYIKSETGQRIISKYFVWNNVSSRKWEWRIWFCLISLMQLFKGDSHKVHWSPFGDLCPHLLVDRPTQLISIWIFICCQHTIVVNIQFDVNIQLKKT